MASSKRPDESGRSPPEDLVVMGRVAAPFGIKGWIKLQPFTGAPENLLEYPTWWIGNEDGWEESRVEQGQVQGGALVAKLSGCDDRDTATLYRGKQIAVSRNAFPETAANEFYWADLVGLRVVNLEGEDLGEVAAVFETGANDVLVVQGERERLIPFTEQVVKQVGMTDRVIRVDWAADY